MKAIETHFNGYRFRSRLEARWAVFLTALSIPWEYEPEGFELKNGMRYLPDFRLPDSRRMPDVYVEIKPCFPIPPKERDKLWEFSEGLVRNKRYAGLLVVVGCPGDDTGPAYLRGSFAGEVKSGEIDPGHFFALGYKATEQALIAAVIAARSARFEFGESP